MWQAAAPKLAEAARQGPLLAQEVCMVVRFVAEEVTQYADDLEVREHEGLEVGVG